MLNKKWSSSGRLRPYRWAHTGDSGYILSPVFQHTSHLFRVL